MRILMVNDFGLSTGGGTEVYIGRLMEGLKESGDVTELFTYPNGRLGIARILDVWNPAARRRLARRVSEFRPDIVHMHNTCRELSVSVFRSTTTPMALSVHDHRILGVLDGPYSPSHAFAYQRIVIPFQKRIIRDAVSATLPVSTELAESLQSQGFRNICVLPAIAPTPITQPKPVDECRDIIFAGRLSPDKGPQVLVAAFERLMWQFPESRLILAGDGPDREALLQATAHMGSRVRLVGRLNQTEMSTLLGGARVVVVPSVRPEGSPLIAVEAAMHGRPVIVSDDPGMRETIEDLQCGYAVPAESPEILASHLVDLLSSDSRAKGFSEAGYEAAKKKHGIAPVVAQLREIYAEMLAVGGRPLSP